MSHQKTDFCLCRLHILARFNLFRFNSPARTRSLNWTSNQSSLSHRRSATAWANYHRCKPDERNTPNKLSRRTLTDGLTFADGRPSAWCVPGCSCYAFSVTSTFSKHGPERGLQGLRGHLGQGLCQQSLSALKTREVFSPYFCLLSLLKTFTAGIKLGTVRFLNVLCSPNLHLFDQKYSKDLTTI